ncbi:MAG TPA: DUF222 domain-containing protein [Candidatus Acidoferrales bacterium]|nr:DUF222 domain-containing protein [Candidatus Acidoferrales bacterium]
MSAQSIRTEILQLCAELHRTEFRLIELIEQLDVPGAWRNDDMPSCAHWLNVRCGIDLVTAREKVRIAHALPKLPLIRAAFRDGELSYSKVRAITRIADWSNEDELVALAKANTAAQVAKRVKDLRQVARLKESKAAFDAYRHRTFTCRTDENGSLIFEGRLPAEQGVLLLQALDRAMDWFFSGQPHRPRLRSDDARVEDIPQEVRRADGLAILAEHFLSVPPLSDEGLSTADRYQLTVHASAEALPELGDIDVDDPPHIEHGPVVAAETLRRIACDAAIVRILETGDGEPLDVGRKTRVISPALQRALKRRDRGCRFPGCANTRFVDGHHIKHWADGGATRLDNLVLLCRHHHRLLHEGGYYLVKDGAAFIFCRGDGELIQARNETPLAALIERANGLRSPRRIGSNTSGIGIDRLQFRKEPGLS